MAEIFKIMQIVILNMQMKKESFILNCFRFAFLVEIFKLIRNKYHLTYYPSMV